MKKKGFHGLNLTVFSAILIVLTFSFIALSGVGIILIERHYNFLIEITNDEIEVLSDSITEESSHYELTKQVSTNLQAKQKTEVVKLRGILIAIEALLALYLIINILFSHVIILYVTKPLKDFKKRLIENRLLREIGCLEFKEFAKFYNEVQLAKATVEAKEEALERKAYHDELTGCLNRQFYHQIDDKLKGYTNPLAFILIDVDKFKKINDTYGHIVGDKVLQRIAMVLTSNFSRDDFIFRFGGDEFAIIAPNISGYNEEIFIERFENVNNILTTPISNLPALSISVGVAFSENGFDSSLYKKADLALYKTKEQGGRGVNFSYANAE